jgi:hypothetical protein
MILVSIFLGFSFASMVARELKKEYSAFDCGQKVWQVRASQNIISNGTDIAPGSRSDMKIFQDWLYSWQNDCSARKCTHIGHNKKMNMGGISRALNYEIRDFFSLLESNCIYRPDGWWIWSEQGNGNCTLGQSAIDCYFQPFSTCGLSNPSVALTIHYNESAMPVVNHTAVFQSFTPNTRDSCGLAEYMKRSLQWVHGQVIHYFMRPRADINETIQSRLHQVYADLPKNNSIIAVHFRGGDLDIGRKVANMSFYIDAVDKLAADLHFQGKAVDRVYICSLDQPNNIISADHMSSLFPRPWKYIVLPHYSVGEVEYYFKSLPKGTLPSVRKRDLFAEFVSDVEIFAHADAFLGSYSNMYPLITSLRIARGVGRLNHSCYLELRNSTPPVYCEGMPEAKGLWKHYFGGYENGRSDFEPVI